MILGSGPNRIGQGIEFDYCCCHAAFALREEGLETVMVNCNPETVSTDYDTADRLYFEPLTFEDVMGIIRTESSAGGKVSCLVQFGGQTPLKLALALQHAGVPILGTSPDSIDLAEDRKRFSALLSELAITQPASGTATSRQEARDVAAAIGFPVVVRPSYVLGGRGMAIVYDVGTLDRYMTQARRRVARASGAHRQVPGGRVRVRRRRDCRRHGRRGDRRHHGAHRGGGHPLGRQLVRGAAVHLSGAAPQHDPRLHAADRARLEGHRPDERAVRHQGRRRLRARGQPARVAHRPVPVESRGRVARQGRRQSDGRAHAGRSRASSRTSRSPASS